MFSSAFDLASGARSTVVGVLTVGGRRSRVSWLSKQVDSHAKMGALSFRLVLSDYLQFQ